jgi:hypothetical protein
MHARFLPLKSSRAVLAGIAISAFGSASGLAQSTWDDRSSQITGGINTNSGIAYNGSRFLMVTAGATYWRSAAGTSNWSFGTLPFPTTNVSGLSIAHGAGATVVAGSKNVLMRTTVADPVGADWTSQRPVSRPDSSTPSLYRARYLNGQFIIGTAVYTDGSVATNSYSEAITSTDGITWTSRKFMAGTVVNQSTANQTFILRDVAFKAGAGAGTGTYVFTTSSNALLVVPESFASATRVTFSASAADVANIITHGAGVFVVITNNGKIFTSPSGASGSWQLRTSPVATASWNDVYFNGSTFVAVGNSVTGSNPARPAIIQSNDAMTWTEATTVPPTSQSLATVFSGDGLWLAGGSGRSLLTSGSASVSAPAFSPQPAAFSGSVGGTITLQTTVTGTPTPTYQWYRNTSPPVALVDDARISGSNSPTLTITGATFDDAKGYYLAATNMVGTTNSQIAQVSLNASNNGAVLTPYGVTNSLGGRIISGATPASALIGGATGRFTVGSGFSALPNTFFNPVSYGYLGGVSPDGTKAVLNASTSGNHPPLVYDLTNNTSQLMPVPALPLGPITGYSFFNAVGIANNGDIAGQFLGQDGVTRGYHYQSSTQVYTLLGNVPNAGNDVATNPGDISADGSTLSGYERIGPFNGPFVWTTTGGFTLLPQPANGGAPNGDIRGISPNGRYIVGFGSVASAIGAGLTAMRWDRGAPAGAPVGFALPRRLTDGFADAFTVNDDGTAGGTVRLGSNDNRAAVWLPSGALVVLGDYLTTQYGLDLTGFPLSYVTSISNDRRTLAGTARLGDSTTQGWILTLPDAIEIPAVPEIAVRQVGTDRASGSTVVIPSAAVGSPTFSQQLFRILNLGSADLTGVSASITGADSADFTYVLANGAPDPLPTTLGVNGFVEIYVRFAPASGDAGTRNAILTITNDDADESPYVLNLQGTAVVPAAQTITFPALADRMTGDAPFTLGASASSGLSVQYVLVSGPATVLGNQVTLTGSSGTVTIEAQQAGNAGFLPATPVRQGFVVRTAGQAALETALAAAGIPANLRGPLDDADADGWNNLLEFAIGLPPAGGASGPLSFTGNVITPGTPIVSGTTAVFVRRKSHAAEGLVYTVEFSPDLDEWTPDQTIPSVLADDGVHQVVAVQMPLAPAQHFRVVVRLTP